MFLSRKICTSQIIQEWTAPHLLLTPRHASRTSSPCCFVRSFTSKRFSRSNHWNCFPWMTGCVHGERGYYTRRGLLRPEVKDHDILQVQLQEPFSPTNWIKRSIRIPSPGQLATKFKIATMSPFPFFYVILFYVRRPFIHRPHNT